MPALQPYFSKFPVLQYDIAGTNVEFKTVINLLKRVRLREKVKNNLFIYYDYDVMDGERPDIVAEKYYGSSQYHWLVLFSNSIVDPLFEWPLEYNDFIALVEKKYGSVPEAHRVVHHYELSPSGLIIDEDTYNATPAGDRRSVSNYEYEEELNDTRRSIKLIDKTYLGAIDAELEALLAE